MGIPCFRSWNYCRTFNRPLLASLPASGGRAHTNPQPSEGLAEQTPDHLRTRPWERAGFLNPCGKRGVLQRRFSQVPRACQNQVCLEEDTKKPFSGLPELRNTACDKFGKEVAYFTRPNSDSLSVVVVGEHPHLTAKNPIFLLLFQRQPS